MNSAISWEKLGGLLPAVVQDSRNGELLMLAYMNKEALELTRSTRIAHYFSRSKQRIWKKGESSGHLQHVKEIFIDCDGDTILLKVEQVGVACHTGNRSCFFTPVPFRDSADSPVRESAPTVDTSVLYNIADSLYEELLGRKSADVNSSYSAQLFHKGENTIGKKIVEEAAELSFALKDGNEREIIYEATDLLYHALVGLAFRGIAPDRVRQELLRRRGVSGIVEKNAREG